MFPWRFYGYFYNYFSVEHVGGVASVYEWKVAVVVDYL